MGYREIDHLLLNVNKGAAGTGLSRTAHTDSPRPGDSVMVSVADRGMLRVLIHRYHAHQQIVDGEASGAVRDKHGEELIGEATRVRFSYQKIAGIHRR